MAKDSAGISAQQRRPLADGSEMEFVAPSSYSEEQLRERLSQACAGPGGEKQRVISPLRPWNNLRPGGRGE